jgi:hypothetical protein
MLSDADVEQYVRMAYAREATRLTYEEIVARARRRRWWRVFPAALAAVVSAGAVGVALRLAQPPEPDPRPDPAFAARCDELFQHRDDGSPPPTDPPPPRLVRQVFTFEQGPAAVRVYIGEDEIYGCDRRGDGPPTGAVDNVAVRNFGEYPLNYLLVLDRAGGPEYLLGERPEGVDRVVARTAAGAVVPAEIRGIYFAVGAPLGGLAGVVVDAYSGSRLVASGPPTQLRGSPPPAAFADICDRRVAERLAGSAVPAAARQVVASRTSMPEQGTWVRFYGRPYYHGQCRGGGLGSVVLAGFAERGPADPPFPPLVLAGRTVDYENWGHGPVPAGAVSVTVHLADGRRIAADVAGGYFVAMWRNTEQEILEAAVTLVSAESTDTHYERPPGGRLTSRPR